MTRKTETTRAIVLRRYPFQETDCIVVLLSRDLGLVRALAKGLRRSRKRFGGVVDLLNHLEVELARRRSELMLLGGANLLDAYSSLGSEPMRMAAGCHLAEVAAAFASEDHPEPEIYGLLVGGLAALEAGLETAPVSRVLELRVLAAAGLAPRLDVCTVSGRVLAPDEEVAFEPRHGGAVCLQRAAAEAPRLSAGTRALMIRLLQLPLAEAWGQTWTREQLQEARAALLAAVQYHLGKGLRARAFAEKAARFSRDHQRGGEPPGPAEPGRGV